MKYASLIILFAVLYISACDSQKNKYAEARVIYDQAIVVHDEVMPYMGKIMNLQKELKSIKDTITSQSEIDLLNKNLQDLENAHNAMMNWMRTLTPVPADDNQIAQMENKNISPKEMVKIQEKALSNIEKVRTIMNSSMKNAEELINQYKE